MRAWYVTDEPNTKSNWQQILQQFQAAAPIVVKPITDSNGRVAFASVLAITRQECATCHGSYTDSAKLSASAPSVEAAVQSGYMPYQGVPPLTQVQKATLIAWLNQEQGL